MSKAQDLADEALDLFDNLRAQIERIVIEVKAHDYGDSGDSVLDALSAAEDKLAGLHTLLEDTYALIEDLQEAP